MTKGIGVYVIIKFSPILIHVELLRKSNRGHKLETYSRFHYAPTSPRIYLRSIVEYKHLEKVLFSVSVLEFVQFYPPCEVPRCTSQRANLIRSEGTVDLSRMCVL